MYSLHCHGKFLSKNIIISQHRESQINLWFNNETKNF
jgi:hypothetical protein